MTTMDNFIKKKVKEDEAILRSFRLPRKLYEAVKAKADRDGISVAEVLRRLCEYYLEAGTPLSESEVSDDDLLD